MAIDIIKTRSFKLQSEAVAWAKQEKDFQGPNSGVKWETNRTEDSQQPWQAVLYKNVK